MLVDIWPIKEGMEVPRASPTRMLSLWTLLIGSFNIAGLLYIFFMFTTARVFLLYHGSNFCVSARVYRFSVYCFVIVLDLERT